MAANDANEVPLLQPTFNQFLNLENYIEKVAEPFGKKAGLAKIQVPLEVQLKLEQNHWEAIKNVECKYPTVQLVSKIKEYRKSCFLVQLKPNVRPFVLADHYSNIRDMQNRLNNPEVKSLQEWQTVFWRRMCQHSWNPVTYTAGLEQSLFRQGTDEVFNLNNLNCIAKKGAMVPGIQTPFTYFGSPYTSFPWHVEDYNLYSLSYLHCGAPKIWYGVSHENSALLEAMLDKCFRTNYRSCEHAVLHRIMMTSPDVLREHGVPFSCVMQEKGQLIVTFPGCYHQGFNAGLNIAEAVNYGNVGWVHMGGQYLEQRSRCRCKGIPHVNIEYDKIVDYALNMRLPPTTTPPPPPSVSPPRSTEVVFQADSSEEPGPSSSLPLILPPVRVDVETIDPEFVADTMSDTVSNPEAQQQLVVHPTSGASTSTARPLSPEQEDSTPDDDCTPEEDDNNVSTNPRKRKRTEVAFEKRKIKRRRRLRNAKKRTAFRDLKREVKVMIHSLLLSHREGLTIDKLVRQFNRNSPTTMPYKELGYDTPLHLIQSMPAKVHITTQGGVTHLKAIITQEVEHLHPPATSRHQVTEANSNN